MRFKDSLSLPEKLKRFGDYNDSTFLLSRDLQVNQRKPWRLLFILDITIANQEVEEDMDRLAELFFPFGPESCLEDIALRGTDCDGPLIRFVEVIRPVNFFWSIELGIEKRPFPLAWIDLASELPETPTPLHYSLDKRKNPLIGLLLLETVNS